MNQRRGFIFYRSFLAAIDELPPEYRPILLDAIVRYALCGQAPDFSQRENAFIYRAIWANIQPVLQKDINHFIAGLNGGAPEGNSNASKQPKTTKNNQPPSMMEDGKMKDGKMKDGKMKDGKMKDGQMKDESVTRTHPVSSLFPTIEEVRIYCRENNLAAINVEHFFKHYEASGWLDKFGNPVNWKQKAIDWDEHDKADAKEKEPPLAKDYGFTIL